MVNWARKRLDLSADAIAKAVKSDPERVHAWETGEKRPTFRQAQKLARFLQVPFGYLFLSKPPNEDLPMPDLRTLPGRTREAPDSEFLDLLVSVCRKQEWYKEFLVSEGEAGHDFVGSLRNETEPKTIAAAMHRTLQTSGQLHKQASSWSDYIRRLVGTAEGRGILVFRSGIVGSNTRRKLDVQQIRGLALSDPIAPAIFINSSDARAAQVFTIAHELAHLWLGQSGVSDMTADTASAVVDNKVETVCNAAAAEFLIPNEEFVEAWDRYTKGHSNLRLLARTFWVSTVAILRRASDLGLLSRADYFALVERERNRQIEPKAQASGGNFRRNLVARNSRLLVNALFESVLSGRTLYREAATVLGVKSSTISAMAHTASTSCLVFGIGLIGWYNTASSTRP
jgi:Zn-dependent peptidase ImmA (M78 family)/DNA-binding XRE family transcriptional regulator